MKEKDLGTSGITISKLAGTFAAIRIACRIEKPEHNETYSVDRCPRRKNSVEGGVPRRRYHRVGAVQRVNGITERSLRTGRDVDLTNVKRDRTLDV